MERRARIYGKADKKGNLLTGSRACTAAPKAVESQNRKKKYILAEGTVIPPLADMGVMTSNGAVHKAMYDKFKQINRFLEFIDEIVKDEAVDGENNDAEKQPMRIIDFGCGKSYLTFIVYYYFTFIRKIPVQMTGVDLKEDVIDFCTKLAEKYGYSNLHFQAGDIADCAADETIDMVITLHACDTATDYALYNAVKRGAKYILSVPCCQHELNRQIKNEILEPILKYGLLKERMAALITDGLRAQYLERAGYEAQILEFIDMEHTPKNILIRAVKKRHAKEDNNIEASIKRCEAALRVSPTLGRLLDGFATESANSEKDHPEKEDKEGV